MAGAAAGEVSARAGARRHEQVGDEHAEQHPAPMCWFTVCVVDGRHGLQGHRVNISEIVAVCAVQMEAWCYSIVCMCEFL